jgi:hypothetical protein
MKNQTKLLLLFSLSLACLCCIRAASHEVAVSDYWIWGESAVPPRDWVILCGGFCEIILFWSVGWTCGVIAEVFGCGPLRTLDLRFDRIENLGGHSSGRAIRSTSSTAPASPATDRLRLPVRKL